MNLEVSSAKKKKKIKNNKSETLDYGDGALFTPEIQNVVLILLHLKISQTSFSILIETDAMWFLRLDHKKNSFLGGFLFLLNHSKESQLPCCKDTQTSCEEAPVGDKLSPLTNNQPQLGRHK